MPLMALMGFLFLVLAVLVFILRYILTRNVTKATKHLEHLGMEYNAKQEEITRRLQDAKKEAHEIITQARQEAEATKAKFLQEGSAYKEQVIKETRQKCEDMVDQAEKTCAFLKSEIHQQIENRSFEKACELIQHSLSEKFRNELHRLWMQEAEEYDFNLGRLTVKDKVEEIKLVSAFPLSDQHRQLLHEKLVKRFGEGIHIRSEVDPTLVAGLVISVGQIVIDGSLKDKIQRQIINHSN